MICDKCKTRVPDSAESCPECGFKVGSKPLEIATKACPKCGAVNPAAAKFCMEDGYNFEEAAKLRKEDEIAADMTLKCSLCGTKYPEGIKFCRKDGMPLEPLVSKAPQSDSPPASPVEAETAKPAPSREENAGMDETIRLEPRKFTTRGEVNRATRNTDNREVFSTTYMPAQAPASKAEPTGIRLKEEPASHPQPLKETEGPEAHNALRCSLCGTKYPEGIKFCRKDGMPLEPLVAMAPQSETSPVSSVETDAAKPPRNQKENIRMDETIRLASTRDSIVSGEAEKTGKIPAIGDSLPLPDVPVQTSVSLTDTVESTSRAEVTSPMTQEKTVVGDPASQPESAKKMENQEEVYAFKCTMCGTRYPEGIKFCRKDGMPLEPLVSKAPQPDSAPASPVAEPADGAKPSRDRGKEESDDGTIYAGSLRNPIMTSEAEKTAKEQKGREFSPPDARAGSESMREPTERIQAKDGFPEESGKTAIGEPASQSQDQKTVGGPELRDTQVRERSEIRFKEEPAPQVQPAKEAEGPEAQYTVRCPKCGTMNPEEANFCRKDGTVLKPRSAPATGGKTEKNEKTVKDLPHPNAPIYSASTEAPSEIRFKEEPAPQVQSTKEAEGPEAQYTVRCPKCGTMNPEEAVFCRKDGTALKGQASPAASGTVSTAQKPEKSPAPMRASAPATKTEAPKKSKTVLWITLSLIVLLLVGAGGFLYYKNFSGMRPATLQTRLNEELKGKGLNVTAEISKDWTVTLSGSVRQQAEKDLALTAVSLHKEAKNITDNIVFERTPAAVQADIQKGLAERGLTAVQAQVDENFVATLSGSANNEDEKTVAMDIGRSVNGVKEVQNMVTVKVEKQQVTPPPVAETQNSKSKAARAKAAAAKRDSSKTNAGRLEGEINRALKNAGMSSVSAEVKDDMSAVVKGTVPSAGDKQRAMQIVQGFRQIKNVRDIVFVVGQ